MVIDSQLVTLLIKALLTYGPGVYGSIVDLLKKDQVTIEDLEGLRNIVNTPFEDYIKSLPPAVLKGTTK